MNELLNELLSDAAQRAARYLAAIDARPVHAPADAIARLAELDVPLPALGRPPEEVLRQLDTLGSPATVASAGGRYFGYVVGGALPVSVAAHWLATAWDQNAASAAGAPATAAFEQVALRWLRELLGLPDEAAGAFVSGTTMGNVCALAAARHAVLARAGWDVEADGLFGA